MKPRPLVALGLLLLLLAAGAQALAQHPSPAQPGPGGTAPAADQEPTVRILRPDGTPDTTHYLLDDAVLGRIDDRVFRAGEFVERWFSSYLLDRPKTDSAGRHEFLNAMVNKEVLAALAREVDRPLSFEDRAILRETRERLLSNAVFARLVADSARYTNEEIRHAYEQGKHQLRLQRLVTADPATAEQARAEVIGKRLGWAEAVRRYSQDPDARGPDGEMGWLRWDELNPAVSLEVFDLPDGGVSRVFRDGRTWWFARVAERRPYPQPSLQRVGKLLAQQILSVKLGQRTEMLREQVRGRIGMTYDSVAIASASARFADTERRVQGDDPTPVLDLAGHIPDFEPADTARVLARWNDGRFSLGRFLAAYNATPVPQRDKVGTFSAFRAALDRYALEPHMARLAEEHGLERDSIVVAGMTRKEEQIRVEHLFGDSIETALWVSDEERRKYYEERQPDFYSLPKVTYAVFGRYSKAGADSLVARLTAGETAAEILRADSLAGTLLGSIKTEGERDGGEFHQLVFEELREGDIRVLGPNKRGEYLLFQKLEHDPGSLLPFAEVQGLIDESLQNRKGERMLQEFIARHRARHDVELHPELLMRVRLSDPKQ